MNKSAEEKQNREPETVLIKRGPNEFPGLSRHPKKGGLV
jgi:hypothetical protein